MLNCSVVLGSYVEVFSNHQQKKIAGRLGQGRPVGQDRVAICFCWWKSADTVLIASIAGDDFGAFRGPDDALERAGGAQQIQMAA
jgi:hypothetical protein